MTDVAVKRPKRPRDPAQLAKLIVDIATGEVDDEDPPAGKDAVRSPPNWPRKRPNKSRLSWARAVAIPLL
jgi:hypothetical protein